MSSLEFNEANWIRDPAVVKTIHELQNLPVHEITLKLAKSDLPAAFIANQVRGRKTAAKKFPWTLEIDTFIYPPGINLEQSSSWETATYKALHFVRDKDRILDGCAGMGTDAMAFAQKAHQVTALESNAHLAAILQHNARQAGIENLTVINSSFEDFMARNNEAFDLIYLDPDRRSQKQKAVSLADCTPDLTREHERICRYSSRQLYKLSPMMDITLATQQLNDIHEVHIVGTKNECREVLLYGAPSLPPATRIVCADFNEQWESFEYSREEETGTVVSYEKTKKYLYIPSATILKAGPYKLFASRYDIEKLAADTHIYTSETLKQVQGRAFEVLETIPYHKESVSDLLKQHGSKYNVICRNFSLKAPQFVKKHKVKEGGSLYLLAYKDCDKNLWVSLCKRIY